MNRLSQKIIYVVVSPMLFFLALELATRMIWSQDVDEGYAGVVLQGSNRIVTHKGIQYRVNSLGLRNEEIELSKPNGTKRILTLGDSFLFGDGIAEKDLVTPKIEKVLERDNAKVNVINAGIGSSNTEDQYEQLLRLAPIYDPDVVVVFFFTNDVLPRGNRRWNANENRWQVNAGFGIGGVGSWRMKVKEYLRRKSKLCAFLYFQYKAKYTAKFGVPDYLLPGEYFDLDDTKPGWVAFKKALLNIQDFCRQQRMEFKMVLIPTLTALNEKYPYSELREKVTAFVESNNIHHTDLFDEFAKHNPAELWVSPENTHWNGLATTIAANEVAKYIRQHNLLR